MPQYNLTLKGIIYKLRKFEEYNIICKLPPNIIIGDKLKTSDIVRFEIANLKDLFGGPVRTENAAYRNRLTFKNFDAEIIIDKSPDAIKLKPKLSDIGGYQLFLYGTT